MKALRKLIVSLMCLVFSGLLTIWSLMWGWGLEAHNWTVIIWAIVLQFGVVVFQVVGASDDK